MSCLFWTLNIILIILELVLQNAVDAQRPGEVYPHRVEIEIGGSTNISCSMNLSMFNGKDSRSLYFVKDRLNATPVPESDITIINDTDIVYMLRNAPEQNERYICKSNNLAIDMATIVVGTKPLDINDFKCINYDYEYMLCDFTIPNNKIPTPITLNFNAGSEDYFYNCSTIKIDESHFYCNITNLPQFISQKYLKFKLMSSNSLGTNVQTIEVNQDKCNIPAKPNLTLHNITTNSVLLLWEIDTAKYMPQKLMIVIRVRLDNFNWRIQPYNVKRKKKRINEIEINDLPYPYYNYTLEVRIKRKEAPDEDTMWSEAFIAKFQTKSCAPNESPQTDIGSFHVISDIVRIYWQQLPRYKHNGANFKYVITEAKMNGKLSDLKPNQMDNTSATFKWHPTSRYEFSIKSQNDEGSSNLSNSVIVPAMRYSETSHAPQWIRNEFHELNKTYTLSWNPPDALINLTDYTVFWCPRIKDANECTETLKFQHVDKHKTTFNIATIQNDEHPLNFAVSANYKDYSSGMHWSMCTAYDSTQLEKLVPVITAGSYRIDLEWEFKVCGSKLEGYNLSYCKVKNAENSVCLDAVENVIIEKSAKNYTLQNLEPFTTYKLQILMFSKTVTGIFSDEQYVTTAEEAPSTPRDLIFINKTTNSIWLSWLPPKYFNGIIRSYSISVNGHWQKLNCELELECSNELTQRIAYNLSNLQSYTDYHLFVKAQTTKESETSNVLNVATLIGVPSAPQMVKNEEYTNGSVLVQWDKPAQPAGRIEFYEVIIKVDKGNVTELYISRVLNATSCFINKPSCVKITDKYTFEVRAVNVANRYSETDAQILLTDAATNNDAMLLHNSNNDKLKCTNPQWSETREKYIISTYFDDSNVLLRSALANGFSYNCLETVGQANWMQALPFLILLLIAIAIIFAYLCLTKNKMKRNDILPRLPSALDMSRDQNSDMENDDLTKHQEAKDSKEALLKLCIDSKYVSNDFHTPSSGYGSSDSSADYLQHDFLHEDTYKLMKTTKVPEMQTRLDDVQTHHHVPANGINTVSGCELNSSAFQNNCPANDMTIFQTNNGYIKPNSNMNWQSYAKTTTDLPLTINGYVMPQSPQMSHEERFDDSKYKINLPKQAASDTRQNPYISGYVKQSDLTAFGQQSVG